MLTRIAAAVARNGVVKKAKVWFGSAINHILPTKSFRRLGILKQKTRHGKMNPTIGPIHSRGVLKTDRPHPPQFAVHQGYGTSKTGDPVRFPLNVAPHGNRPFSEASIKSFIVKLGSRKVC